MRFRSTPAVTTGGIADGGQGEQKAHPCLVPPVSLLKDTWAENIGNAFARTSSIGPTVPALGSVRYPVGLDLDYTFKMLWVRYRAFYSTYNLAGLPTRTSWDPARDVHTGHNAFPFMVQCPTPMYPWAETLNRYITVKLWVPTMNDVTLYGDARNRVTGQYVYLAADAIQGNESGIGQLRVPHLINRAGQIQFEFVNSHATYPLTVNFVVYGMKVRV